MNIDFETREYIEANRAEINKRAYDGDISALNVIRAYHLWRPDNISSANLLMDAVDVYKRSLGNEH